MTKTNEQDFILQVLNANCGDSVKEKVLSKLDLSTTTIRIDQAKPGADISVVLPAKAVGPKLTASARDLTGLPDSHSKFRIPDWEGGSVSSFVVARMLGVPGHYFSVLASEYKHLFRHCKTERYYHYARLDVEKFHRSEQYPLFKRLCDELVKEREDAGMSVNCSDNVIASKLSSTSLNWALIKGGYRGHPQPAI